MSVHSTTSLLSSGVMTARRTPGAVLSYRIDGNDRINAMQGDWDGFAYGNAATDLGRDRVLGNSIWQFISGLETVEIHRLLFKGVRERDLRVTLAFRCDSPRLRRDMEMTVQRHGRDEVVIHTRLLREREQRYIPLLDGSVRRSSELLKVCSWCKKVQLPTGWVEVEHAIREMRLLALPPVPRISHGMCQVCLQRFRESLEQDRRDCS